MSTAALVPLETYLRTTWRPDREYVDGEVVERNLGQFDHARLQTRLAIWFGTRERQLGVLVVVEQRVRVSPNRYRIPDVCVISNSERIEQVITRPPLICIEVLSPEDTLHRLQARVDDYLAMGVRDIWAIDPESRRAYVCTKDGFRECDGGVVTATSCEVRVPLAEIYAELD